jgi:hypothetical protein
MNCLVLDLDEMLVGETADDPKPCLLCARFDT